MADAKNTGLAPLAGKYPTDTYTPVTGPSDACLRCSSRYRHTPISTELVNADTKSASYVCHYRCHVCGRTWNTSWLLSALDGAA